MLQSMGSRGVGHDLATEQKQQQQPLVFPAQRIPSSLGDSPWPFPRRSASVQFPVA